MILAIDIGNTRTKVIGFGDDKTVLHKWVLATESLEEALSDKLSLLDPDSVIQVGWISTARPLALKDLPAWSRFQVAPVITEINSQTEWPIRNLYATPKTLGTDRIVAVIGACSYCPGNAVMVIDAGTAITYDLADADRNYLGGAIAPGLRMRFRALHEFTARLPLIEPVEETPLIGNSTEASIRAGVIHATAAEMDGMIERYKEVLGTDTQVFLTGGDKSFFEFRLKNLNFATSNLILEGIYNILQPKSFI